MSDRCGAVRNQCIGIRSDCETAKEPIWSRLKHSLSRAVLEPPRRLEICTACTLHSEHYQEPVWIWSEAGQKPLKSEPVYNRYKTPKSRAYAGCTVYTVCRMYSVHCMYTVCTLYGTTIRCNIQPVPVSWHAAHISRILCSSRAVLDRVCLKRLQTPPQRFHTGSSTLVPDQLLSDSTAVLHPFLTGSLTVLHRFLTGSTALLNRFLTGSTALLHRFLTGSLTVLHRFLTGSTALLHRFLTGSLTVLHRFLTGSTAVLHRFLTGSLTVLHRFLTGSTALLHRFLTGSLRPEGGGGGVKVDFPVFTYLIRAAGDEQEEKNRT